jgi:hypothetical protein
MAPLLKGKDFPSQVWLLSQDMGSQFCSWPSLSMRPQGALTEPLDPAKPIKTPFLKLQQTLLQAPALFQIEMTLSSYMSLREEGWPWEC